MEIGDTLQGGLVATQLAFWQLRSLGVRTAGLGNAKLG